MSPPLDPQAGCCALRPPAPPAPPVPGDWASLGRAWRGPLPAFPTKKARLAFLRAALGARPAWARRALEIVLARQTDDERAVGATIARNGAGFSGVDAEILTSFARQLAAGRALSPRQEAVLLRRMPKYAGQLAALVAPLDARPAGAAGTQAALAWAGEVA